jgi:hypothetical protein
MPMVTPKAIDRMIRIRAEFFMPRASRGIGLDASTDCLM